MQDDLGAIAFFGMAGIFALAMGLLRARLRARVVRQGRKLGPSGDPSGIATLRLRERFVN